MSEAAINPYAAAGDAESPEGADEQAPPPSDPSPQAHGEVTQRKPGVVGEFLAGVVSKDTWTKVATSTSQAAKKVVTAVAGNKTVKHLTKKDTWADKSKVGR
jgi:hypothetical protein